jgi:hypothetical protein
VKDSAYARRKRILSDPGLAKFLAAIAGEITWQRLRVAVEALGAVISGRGTDKSAWVNVLAKKKYATREEILRFKENIEHPEQSGVDAAHGVSTGHPPKYAKMSEQQGLDFVIKVFNAYVDRQR